MAGSNQALSFSMPAYPLDKIFYRPEPDTVAVSQSASPSVPTYTTVSIPHDVGATFFIDVQVSPDGTNWYDEGFEPRYLSGGVYYARFITDWGVSTTDVVLRFAALDASYTFNYRIVGYTKD